MRNEWVGKMLIDLQYKRLNFDRTDKPEFVQENEILKIRMDLKIKTDYQNQIRNKKMIICHLVELGVPSDRRVTKKDRQIPEF